MIRRRNESSEASRPKQKLGDIRIGISGWRYKPWRGIFYPKGLTQKRELAFAAENFRSVEINGTFYSLQIPSSFERWAAETPDDFVFAVSIKVGEGDAVSFGKDACAR